MMYYPGFHSTSAESNRLRWTNTERGRQTVTITEFSNGKGSTAFAQRHRNQQEEVTKMCVFVFLNKVSGLSRVCRII